MKRRAVLLLTLAVLSSISVLLAPGVTQAATSSRSITEFVDAQGTFCWPQTGGGCAVFIPPVANFIGWNDPAKGLNASVDYAGLANRAFHGAFGTTFDGTITERPLTDGTAEVSVLLRTHNAITWVIQGADFVDSPLVFGERWTTAGPPNEPALGWSELQVVFINTAPGAPLPDLEQVFVAPARGQAVRFIAFRSNASGSLPTGGAGRAQVTQTGVLMSKGSGGPRLDFFPAEHVNVTPTGN